MFCRATHGSLATDVALRVITGIWRAVRPEFCWCTGTKLAGTLFFDCNCPFPARSMPASCRPGAIRCDNSIEGAVQICGEGVWQRVEEMASMSRERRFSAGIVNSVRVGHVAADGYLGTTFFYTSCRVVGYMGLKVTLGAAIQW